MSDPANSYSGQASWLGVGPPLVIGVGIFAARASRFMLVWRTQDKRYWDEKAGLPDPDVVHGLKSRLARPRRTGRLGRWQWCWATTSRRARTRRSRRRSRWRSKYGEELILVYGAGPPGGIGEEFKAHREALMEMGRTATAHALETRRGGRGHRPGASSWTRSRPTR